MHAKTHLEHKAFGTRLGGACKMFQKYSPLSPRLVVRIDVLACMPCRDTCLARVLCASATGKRNGVRTSTRNACLNSNVNPCVESVRVRRRRQRWLQPRHSPGQARDDAVEPHGHGQLQNAHAVFRKPMTTSTHTRSGAPHAYTCRCSW